MPRRMGHHGIDGDTKKLIFNIFAMKCFRLASCLLYSLWQFANFKSALAAKWQPLWFREHFIWFMWLPIVLSCRIWAIDCLLLPVLKRIGEAIKTRLCNCAVLQKMYKYYSFLTAPIDCQMLLYGWRSHSKYARIFICSQFWSIWIAVCLY